ncbi:hypothetical protein Tsubulata_010742 [Turnera subulata]|uniref:Protein kinase domain-containing protein n=1 Tax=Turnera subulata TaxID=218843 RepID=A0A9Q0JA38_9ROSI|nr:hypothetical protein Tsubulata_010742 [Turnera subulata]
MDEVAIKVLDTEGKTGRAANQVNREFVNELTLLDTLEQDNIVNIIGYAAGGGQRELVFEYLALGTLEKKLHDLPAGQAPLTGDTRVQVALGVARALEYLHHRDAPIVHGDIKPDNIMFGEGLIPKVIDFGFSRELTEETANENYRLPPNEPQPHAWLCCTRLLTGEKPTLQENQQLELQNHFILWAKPLVTDPDNQHYQEFLEYAEPLLAAGFPQENFVDMMHIVKKCLRDYEVRPDISEIVQDLKAIGNGANPDIA